jgi:uncharacterized protein (DUF2141 family)
MFCGLKQKLDTVQMIDAGGGDLCTTLGLGQYEGALLFVRIACLVAILVAGVAAEAALSRSKIFLEGGAARRGTIIFAAIRWSQHFMRARRREDLESLATNIVRHGDNVLALQGREAVHGVQRV